MTLPDMFHHFGVSNVLRQKAVITILVKNTDTVSQSQSDPVCLSLFSGALRGQTPQFCSVRLPEPSRALSSSG